MGVRRPLLKWLQSYLSGCQQQVVLEGTHCEWQNITAGVPQGSVVGPLLFLVYINDMVNDIQSEAFLYADDSMFLDIVESPIGSAMKLNTDLVSVATWVNKWNLLMNSSKTRAMAFSVKKEKTHPPLILNNEIIPDVSSYYHLGITLSNDLTHQHNL